MAMEYPSLSAPPREPSLARRRLRGTANPRDAHRRGCWYRRRSRAAAAVIDEISQPLPGRFVELRLPAFALEPGAAQLERRLLLRLGDDTVQPALHQRP